MATDALIAVQASVTKTGTFNSTGVHILGGTPRRGLWVRILYSAAATSSGAGAATFRVTESDDNATFTGIYEPTEAALTLSATAIAGELFIPVSTKHPYIRLELSAISGTGASVTYQGDLVDGEPA